MKTNEKSVGKIKKAEKRDQKTCGEFVESRTVPYLLYLDTLGDGTEIGIFIKDKMLASKKWNGKADLSETLLVRIEELLKHCKLKLSDLNQITVNPGPGSYTGLRIGITVANFLAWSLKIPIVAARICNKKLTITGVKNRQFILPKYQRPADITKPKPRS